MTCTCTLCKLQCLGISEYLIPLSQIVLTCSNPSHSPEDAVILIVLRRMSLSNLYFPGLNLTFLDLYNRCIHRHSPFTIHQHLDKPTQKSLKKLCSLSERHCRISQRHCRVPLQKGPSTQYEFTAATTSCFRSGCLSGWFILQPSPGATLMKQAKV